MKQSILFLLFLTVCGIAFLLTCDETLEVAKYKSLDGYQGLLFKGDTLSKLVTIYGLISLFAIVVFVSSRRHRGRRKVFYRERQTHHHSW